MTPPAPKKKDIRDMSKLPDEDRKRLHTLLDELIDNPDKDCARYTRLWLDGDWIKPIARRTDYIIRLKTYEESTLREFPCD